MNIYKVYRIDTVDYDQYAGFVCIAKSEEDAVCLHPNGQGKYDLENRTWGNVDGYCTWVSDLNVLDVELVGIAEDTFAEGDIVLKDFMAG